MNQFPDQQADEAVQILNADARSPIVLICEHASAHMPAGYDDLGLNRDARHSHVAWDPGAFGVARHLSDRLDAILLAGTVSRLIYDLNRPPDAQGAMPARSERIDVPGNAALDPAEKARRIRTYYEPFHAAVSEAIAAIAVPMIVTIHSFTRIYEGQTRDVEIGVLHDTDSRLADAMLAQAARFSSHAVRRNAPYGPQDGVTHTLRKHGLAHGHVNVMIEVRNDLISDDASQRAMADLLAEWLAAAVNDLAMGVQVECKA